jgi:zinc transporter ZupT
MSELLFWFSIIGAAFFGLFVLVGMLIILRRSIQFGKRGYWLWLGVAAGAAVITPLVYMWQQSGSISLADAVLLRQFQVGSSHVAGAAKVLRGYAVLTGIVVAGLINLMLPCRSNM